MFIQIVSRLDKCMLQCILLYYKIFIPYAVIETFIRPVDEVLDYLTVSLFVFVDWIRLDTIIEYR